MFLLVLMYVTATLFQSGKPQAQAKWNKHKHTRRNKQSFEVPLRNHLTHSETANNSCQHDGFFKETPRVLFFKAPPLHLNHAESSTLSTTTTMSSSIIINNNPNRDRSLGRHCRRHVASWPRPFIPCNNNQRCDIEACILPQLLFSHQAPHPMVQSYNHFIIKHLLFSFH